MIKILAVAVALLIASMSFAQVFTATLSGLVTDQSGAGIPGATVHIRNLETNDVRELQSGSEGRYTFSQLKPGPYEITIEAKGFKRFVQPSLTLVASQVGEFNASMEVGEASQRVEVSASAPVLDTQSADKAVTLETRQILDLPTNFRNPLVLVWQTAGVVAVRTGLSQASQEQNQNRFALNGGRDEGAALLIDGVPSTSGDWGGALATPSIEATGEVQVVRNTFDVQYGRTDGGVVSVVTKGGTDSFHGSAYDYLRNSRLDANTWDNNRAGVRKPVFQRNQFGGTLGGPIWKSKHLYFFGSYDGMRQGTPSTTLVNVPTALEQNGDFSQTFNASGVLSTIYNPFTTRANPNGGGFIRDPFPGNVIPKNLWDPVGAKVLSLMPQPNLPGNELTHALNYGRGGKTVGINDKIDIRVDWAKNEHYSFFVRVTKGWEKNDAPKLLGNNVDNNFSDRNPRHQVVIANTFVPTPTWVTNILIGSGRWRENQISPSQGLDATSIGLPASIANELAAKTIPAFSLSNYVSLGNSRDLNDPRTTNNLQINNSKSFRSHGLKFGFIAEVMQINATDVRSADFTFNRGLTSGPIAATDSTTSGNAIASLLLGTGASGTAPNAARLALEEKYYALYVQDTWRIGRKLTVDYGIRYDLQLPATERYNRVNNFAFQTPNPVAQQAGLNLKGGLAFRDKDNRGLWDTQYKNFAPRLGVSYKITDKLVVRTGYGIYYPPAWAGAATADGFSVTTQWVSTVGGGGILPNNPLSNPFPQGFLAPPGSSQGPATLVGQSVSAYIRKHDSPYVQAYSLDFQYQLNNSSMLEVGYSGSQGRKLFYGYNSPLNQNQLDPKYLSLGADLNTPVQNPFFGIIQNGTLSGSTIPRYQLLLPFPQFLNVNLSALTPGASSSFNALLVKFNHRLNHGLQFLATYQWSKAIDNASETQGWEIADTQRNNYNYSIERSISGHDIPQDFTASMLYELPVGKGRAHLASLPKAADYVVGGWQISSTMRFGSGLPLQFTAPNTLSQYGYPVARPNITSLNDLATGQLGPDHAFNTAAISAPAPFTIGSAPRWVSNLRHGPLNSADISLSKRFDIWERLRMTFRADAFNVSNTPQYGRPNTTVGNGAFGQVTGTTYVTPRNIQVALRFDF